MGSPSVPEEGDIVVREDRRDGERIYLLHSASGVDQILLRSRDDAVQRAVAVARRERTRAWLAEGGGFMLVQDFRIVESV